MYKIAVELQLQFPCASESLPQKIRATLVHTVHALKLEIVLTLALQFLWHSDDHERDLHYFQEDRTFPRQPVVHQAC